MKVFSCSNFLVNIFEYFAPSYSFATEAIVYSIEKASFFKILLIRMSVLLTSYKR